jgi:hypothetical protein
MPDDRTAASIWRMTSTNRWTGFAAGALALAGATAATWWMWLGRDTKYQVEPVSGVATGPYEVWQVAGCVLCLMALAVIGGLLLRPWIVVPIMTLAFTILWSVNAASHDETGLWGVGAILVLVGMTAGSAVLSFGAWMLRAAIRRQRNTRLAVS